MKLKYIIIQLPRMFIQATNQNDTPIDKQRIYSSKDKIPSMKNLNMGGIFMQIKCYISSTLIDMGIETTNEELSTMWGVHRNTVTNLIKGKTLPNLQTAYMIVDYFNQQAELKGIARRWTVEDIWRRQE